jgi:predicted phage terminase large subunit-like protein
MGDLERNRNIIEQLHRTDLSKLKNLSMLYDMALTVQEDDLGLAISEMKTVKVKTALLTRTEGQEATELYWNSMLFLAQNRQVDEGLIYLERYRLPEDRFYLPRRRVFRKLGITQALQRLVDDEIDILTLSFPPGTGKTTCAEMFLSLWIGWDPDACNLFSSHSGHVTRMVYDVLNNIIGADLKKGQTPEYAWREIFPDVQVQDINAKEETINLGKFKPFKSITFRAIGASQTGVTRADGLLYCDDLCSGIEEALSKQRLDKLWQKYTTDLKTRKKGGRKDPKTGKYHAVKELHIATRWSVWDVIGRIQKQYLGDGRCEFISLPDIDPETGESNWEYEYGVGFDRQYFEDIEATLDPITYKCLFKNQPVEREGLLFEPDILRRYDELPEGKYPDAIMAFLDPKGTGLDYNCLGVFYQYGDDYYMEDVVFRNIDPYVLDDLNADCLVRNNVQICQVESNKEGVRTGDSIQEKVKERGGRCVIEKKFATTNKETRIIVSSPWIINHVLFKKPKSNDNPDGYAPNSEYGQFMSYLTSYSQLTKNTHDDAPDMVTMLAIHEGADGDSITAAIHGSVF